MLVEVVSSDFPARRIFCLLRRSISSLSNVIVSGIQRQLFYEPVKINLIIGRGFEIY